MQSMCKEIHNFLRTGEIYVITHRRKKFCCSTCNKRFSLAGGLNNHMRTHTGEKPYPCTVCGKRFTTRANMISHMRIHTGDKPYSCTECIKKFATSCQHTKYMSLRLHTGEKPYSCSECDKKFARSSGYAVMLEHIKKVKYSHVVYVTRASQHWLI